MRTLPFAYGLVLLSVVGCAPGEGVYATSAPGYVPGYAPFYAPGYAPAYGYSFATPSYAPPPLFGNAFEFQFGGRRHEHDRDHEHDHGDGDRYRRD